jgi:hypothetical protein
MRTILLLATFSFGVFFLHARAADCVTGCKEMKAWKNVNVSGNTTDTFGMRMEDPNNNKLTIPVAHAISEKITVTNLKNYSSVADGGDCEGQTDSYYIYKYKNASTVECTLKDTDPGRINVTFPNETDWNALVEIQSGPVQLGKCKTKE